MIYMKDLLSGAENDCYSPFTENSKRLLKNLKQRCIFRQT